VDPTRPAVITLLPEPDPRLSSAADLPTMLDSIVHALSQLTPGAEVGITVVNNTGAYEAIAATHPLAFVLDDIQRDLDEGPCLTVMRQGHTVIIDDAQSENRWPRFVPRALDLGLCSYVGVAISVDDQTLGALNLYSTIPSPLDAVRLSHAKLFAAQAATAIRHARGEIHLDERSGLDEEEAFAHLAGLSQRTTRRLHDIAASVVEQSNRLRHCLIRGEAG
jgi:GAF domain-containing protein